MATKVFFSLSINSTSVLIDSNSKLSSSVSLIIKKLALSLVLITTQFVYNEFPVEVIVAGYAELKRKENTDNKDKT